MTWRPVGSKPCAAPRRAQARPRGVGWGACTSMRCVRGGRTASKLGGVGRRLTGRVGSSELEFESFLASMTCNPADVWCRLDEPHVSSPYQTRPRLFEWLTGIHL